MTDIKLDKTGCPINAFSFVKNSVEYIMKNTGARSYAMRYNYIGKKLEIAENNGMPKLVGILLWNQIMECENEVMQGIEL